MKKITLAPWIYEVAEEMIGLHVSLSTLWRMRAILKMARGDFENLRPVGDGASR